MDEPLVFSITFFFFLILLRISLVTHGGLGRGRKEEEGELIIYFETCKEYLRFSQFFLFHVISKQLLCHLRRHFCVLWFLVFNYFFRCLARSTKQTWKSSICFFTDGKQHKARELDTITLRNHAPLSYITWLLVPLSVLDMIIVQSAARWRPRRWFRKFTVRFRPFRKEIVSWIYNCQRAIRAKTLGWRGGSRIEPRKTGQ